MPQLAALAERLQESAHHEAYALDRLEVIHGDRARNLAPRLAHGAEAREDKLLRDVREDVRDVGAGERGLERACHLGVVAGTVFVAERGEDVREARDLQVMRGIQVDALEHRLDGLGRHGRSHARGGRNGLHVSRRGCV